MPALWPYSACVEAISHAGMKDCNSTRRGAPKALLQCMYACRLHAGVLQNPSCALCTNFRYNIQVLTKNYRFCASAYDGGALNGHARKVAYIAMEGRGDRMVL